MSGRDHRRRSGAGRYAAAFLLCGLVAAVRTPWGVAAEPEDWPTYRHDGARSGVTTEELRPPLAPCWVYEPLHAPRPAWGDPNPRPIGGWYGLTEKRRVHFDDVFHVAVAGGAVYFGSSADGAVRALDAATGRVRWSFLTGGPVRLTPSVWRGKVYFGSDDGYAYCLRAEDGREVWRFRAAPAERQVLGSGQMISLWPLRTGVLVEDGIAYLGAGLFPAEGVYLYALNAEDGKRIWCNDSFGDTPQSRLSPQGHLVATRKTLHVPMGRVSPAGFDRQTGRLLHETYFTHFIGGAYAFAAGERLYTGTEELVGYEGATRGRFAWWSGRQLVVAGDAYYSADEREITATNETSYPEASLQRRTALERKFELGDAISQARQAVQQKEAEARRSDEAREAVEKRLAALGAAAADEAPERAKQRADLEAQFAKAREKLGADQKALDAARKNSALREAEALDKRLKDADAAMAASVRWRCPADGAESLILAGSVLYAGGRNKVVAVGCQDGQLLWTGEVKGTAKGLAVAGGRLFVSTDTGALHCFGAQGSANLGSVAPAPNVTPYPADEWTPVFEAAAEQIVRLTGVRRGYALVLGAGTGRLACELAKRTELVLYGIEKDAGNVEIARARLDAAGVYGARVRVDQGDPAGPPYSNYFANLIVSETALTTGRAPCEAREVHRLLKPLGGTVCLGQPAAAAGKAPALSRAALEDWARGGDLRAPRVAEQDGVWLVSVRGALPGAGSWTHEYAEPGGTACSDDQAVRAPLGVLWFGEPGPAKMAERHIRAVAPLAANGRFFVVGEGTAPKVGAGDNAVMAYDAYNGVKLWERAIRGALRTGVSHGTANLAADNDNLFIALEDRCLRLDAATGETRFTYVMPSAADGRTRRWGYVAVIGERLYGSRTSSPRLADTVFCLDVAAGTLQWKHEIPPSEKPPEPAAAPRGFVEGAIVISDGRLFLPRTDVTPAQRAAALAGRMEEIKRLPEADRAAAEAKLAQAPVYVFTALDAASGKTMWEKPVELTGALGGAYWSALGAIASRGVLLVYGIYTDGHFWSQFFGKQFDSRRVTALAAADGRPLWSRNIGYRVRPVVIGETLHAEPWAFDLRTGEPKRRAHPLTGRDEAWQFARPGHHCGCPAASPHLLLFRSATLGWYDLDGDFGTQHFAGQRPGCWINFLPACGLLLLPEASSGCQCPFPLACTVVFEHRDEARGWAYFSAPGPLTPVKHLAVNFGAPGDRRARDGTLWLGYPRPDGPLVLRFDLNVALYPEGEYFRHDTLQTSVQGTDSPWLFTTGVRGLRRCVVPLIGPGEGAARYTVRLAFAELDTAAPGTRVFDVKLQEQVVAKDFDPVREAGGPGRALVKEFRGVTAKDQLVVELIAPAKEPKGGSMPVLQGLEVLREQVLSLGIRAPSFELRDGAPEQSGEARVANYTEREFSGRLCVEAPDGFSVTPGVAPLKIASGQTVTVALKASVVHRGARGKFPLTFKLLREDGTSEAEEAGRLEYLGPLARTVVKAAEDAFVVKSNPHANKGGEKTILVDGGNAEFGDAGHQVGYLKFRLEIPGKPASAVLRLHNAGNPTGDSGRLCLVTAPWAERTVTYANRPAPAEEIARIGRVKEEQVVELPVPAALLEGRDEVSFALDPAGCDGVDYVAREGGRPAELVIEYQPRP
jgi:outer membrane protein assembly factor BamB